MRLADLIAKMKLSQNDAEVIFDRDEPIGTPTDLVMPRRRGVALSRLPQQEKQGRAGERPSIPLSQP